MYKQKFTDRVCIFRGFTTDEFEHVREELMELILSVQYDEFIEKCEYIKEHEERIVSISCEIVNDKLVFHINEKKD